jgi:hypothetical protein
MDTPSPAGLPSHQVGAVSGLRSLAVGGDAGSVPGGGRREGRARLDTWDAAIVERFDSIRSSLSSARMACTLAIGRDCLASLDQTLNELRKRSQHRSTEAAATGPELMALRSAAVEVAAGAYADGLRKRRRQVSAATGTAGLMPGRTTMDTFVAGRSSPRRPVETVVCLLSRELLEDLDEVLGEVLGGDAADERPAELGEARDVVVESAIASWLILRGYSTVVPSGSHVGGWLGAVRLLASRRKRRPR